MKHPEISTKVPKFAFTSDISWFTLQYYKYTWYYNKHTKYVKQDTELNKTKNNKYAFANCTGGTM